MILTSLALFFSFDPPPPPPANFLDLIFLKYEIPLVGVPPFRFLWAFVVDPTNSLPNLRSLGGLLARLDFAYLLADTDRGSRAHVEAFVVGREGRPLELESSFCLSLGLCPIQHRPSFVRQPHPNLADASAKWLKPSSHFLNSLQGWPTSPGFRTRPRFGPNSRPTLVDACADLANIAHVSRSRIGD